MTLKDRFNETRSRFESICKPLEIEDYSVQPETFVSPPKWHLAHTTWFFEQFVLVSYTESYKVYNNDYAYLFNSYYNNAGKRVLRPNRGLMTRPTVKQVYAYRKHVTEAINKLFETNLSHDIKTVIELGIQHEQQHQELFYYDIKFILGHQPTFPALTNKIELPSAETQPTFTHVKEGIYDIGHTESSFCYDNEEASHKVYLNAFDIRNTLITNAEYVEFIEAGGYSDFNLWHAEGWDMIKQNNLNAPMYWHKLNGQWHYYTLSGFKPLDVNVPVSHISFYEAFAFAQWKDMRLPTEFEWEVASPNINWGSLWEWTNSAYLPYPNFKKAEGALGEYNGKFMVNQMVLKGGSVVTYPGHSRKTYRNFFHPNLRWMYSGIRLVK